MGMSHKDRKVKIYLAWPVLFGMASCFVPNSLTSDLMPVHLHFMQCYIDHCVVLDKALSLWSCNADERSVVRNSDFMPAVMINSTIIMHEILLRSLTPAIISGLIITRHEILG